MPEKLVDARLEEPDSSTIKKTIIEPMEDKKDEWLGRSLVKAMIEKIADTLNVNPEIDINVNVLRQKEEEIAKSLLSSGMDEEQVLDSLMGEGYYQSNKALLDTAMSEVEEEFDVALTADDYLIQNVMPGELIATNGYIDEDGNVIWEVKGDVILTTDYNMWSESKKNTWAWIVTGVFLAFVISGFLIRRFRR
ncbi:MAG: hypothetical protein U9N72_02375 [Bacteroidota bacterium]|nr:hypothetical protein [Bacteroidota bacterium]